MHDYLLSTEAVRLAFMLGVVVSMLLYEKRHLTTGSIVVPGYMATFILYPFVIAATFANALISYAVVNKLLRRWFLLYGRTKFTVLALVSILIQTAMLKLTPSGPWLWESDFKLLVGVGYVVPALVAHDMGRQGVTRTVRSVMLAAALVAVPIAAAIVLDLPGVNDLAPLEGFGDMAIDSAWLPLSVLLSAAAAWGVAHNYGMRSGGFVGAAFIGMFMGDPWQVLVAGSISVVTYLLVAKVLMHHMILFGRRKFSAMLLVASSLSWILLWAGGEFFGPEVQRHLDLGSLALTPLFLPGLIANDAQRTSPRLVLMGFTLASTFVVTWTWWVQSLFEGLALALVWKVVAVGVLGLIFWRQIVPTRAGRAVEASEEVPPVRPARVVAVAPAGAGAAFGTGAYERWAAAHPAAALAAEHWLAAVVGEREQLRPAPTPLLSPAPPSMPSVRPAAVRRPAHLGPSSIERLRTSAMAASSRAVEGRIFQIAGELPVRRRSSSAFGAPGRVPSEQHPLRVDQMLAR